jgi:hypothetical protein
MLACGGPAKQTPKTGPENAVPAAAAEMPAAEPAESAPPAQSAADLEAVEAFLAEAAKRGDHDKEWHAWRMPSKWCKQKVEFKGSVDDCYVRVTALGRAAVLFVKSECQEMCDVYTWFMTGADGFQKVRPLDFGNMVILPDLRTGVSGNYTFDEDGDYTVWLNYLDLSTQKVKQGQECTEPGISPGGKWIVCRDIDGNVVRIPVGGGDPEVFHKTTASSVHTNRETGVGVFEVEFVSPTEMKVKTYTGDEEEVVEKVPWQE